MSVYARTFVDDAVLFDGLGVRVGEKREGVAGFLTEIARLLGRVDADGYRQDSVGAEFGETLFDTP